MDIPNIISEINSFTYNRLVELLYEKVPTYKKINEANPKEINSNIDGYMFMYDFTSHVISELKSDDNSLFIIETFNFIEDYCMSENMEVNNLIYVGVLEILYSTKECRELVRSKLGSKSKVLFEKWTFFYD